MNHCRPPHPLNSRSSPTIKYTAKRVVKAYLHISTRSIYKRNEVIPTLSNIIEPMKIFFITREAKML